MSTLLADKNNTELTALAKATFSPVLSEAEQRIIHDSVRAGPAKALASDRAQLRHVRSEFLRWLLNDRRVIPLIDKDGLQVVASTIDGDLDLDSSHIPYDLRFAHCVFNGDIGLVGADITSVDLSHSSVRGNINFARATAASDVTLGEGFTCDGSITMWGAHISGDLYLKGAKLSDKGLFLNTTEIKGTAFFEDMVCSGPIKITHAVIGHNFFGNGAQISSKLDLTGSTIGGDLSLHNVSCSEALILDDARIAGSIYLSKAKLLGSKNSEGTQTSLSLHNASVDGNVYLTDGFAAAGTVACWQVKVAKDFFVFNASLAELDLSDAMVGNVLWVGILHPERTKLSLRGAHLRSFRDVKSSWPAKGNLRVVGLTYDKILLEVPPDIPDLMGKTLWKGREKRPDDRIEWLRRQSDGDMALPQPWRQLAKYLQGEGNVAGARQARYAMARAQAAERWVGPRWGSFFYDAVVEDPLRICVPVCILWILGTLVFWRARRIKGMIPTDKDAYDHFTRTNRAPPHYVPFNAAVYVLENVLPVVKLGQDAKWGPNPQTVWPPQKGWKRWQPQLTYNWLAFLRWLLIVIGWALALLLAGAIVEYFKQ